MRKKLRVMLIYYLAIPILLLITGFVLFTIFQFTLIADIRENFSKVDEQDQLAYGKLLFNSRSCIGCHSIIPKKKHIGPNLFGISQRETIGYIRESIVTPNAVIVEGFPANNMPEFGKILNDNQIDALVVYLSSLK